MSLTRACTFRLTEEEFQAIAARAQETDRSVSEYVRSTMLQTLQCSPEERSILRRQVIEGELTREFIVKAQDGANLADPNTRAAVMSRVLGRADAVVDGYLNSTNRLGKVTHETAAS